MACGGASDGLGSIAPCQSDGCAISQPRRQWVRAAQISSTLAQNGAQVSPDLTVVPSTDKMGRFAHVVGIKLDCFVDVVIGATINTGFPYYAAAGAFQSIFLQDVSGWQYLAGTVDGRDILDDRFVRNGGYGFGETAPTNPLSSNAPINMWVPTNSGTATTLSVPLNLYIQLAQQEWDGYNMNGAIPLAAIQKAGIGAFKFTFNTPPQTFSNATWSHITTGTFMEVWLELVYLDYLSIDAPWQLEAYIDANTSGALRHGDRIHEYAAVRFQPENTGGQALTDMDNVQWAINGESGSGVALTRYEMLLRNAMIIGNDFYRAHMGWLYPSANATFPFQDWTIYNTIFLLLPYQRNLLEAPAGVVAASFGTRSTHAFTRYLHRTRQCHTEQRAKDITSSAFGCGAAGMPAKTVVIGVDPKGNAVPATPRLPVAVFPNLSEIYRGASLYNPVRGPGPQAGGSVQQQSTLY